MTAPTHTHTNTNTDTTSGHGAETRTERLVSALAVCIAADIPVLVWGPPGVGKSAAITAAAASTGRHLEAVHAALHEPTDFSGLPVVQDDGSVRFAEPAWARRLADSTSGLLFLDEISLAAPTVQAALLRVVLDRRVGELELGSGVAVVAAANPADQANGAFDLGAPLANRLCHLDWPVDPAAVADGFVNGWPTVGRTEVPDGWASAIGERLAQVGRFLSHRPALCHDLPRNEASAGRAWPSPRSWESVARALAAGGAAGISPAVEEELVAGLVGPGAAIEFLSWRANQDLVDVEAALLRPDEISLPTRDDAVWALLEQACTAAEQDPTRWDGAVRLAVRVADAHPERAVRAIQRLVECRPADAAPPEGLGRIRSVVQATLDGGLAA